MVDLFFRPIGAGAAKAALARSKSFTDSMDEMREFTKSKLGKFEGQFICIRDTETLNAYVDRIIENGIAAIDTETTGLCPIKDTLVGVCLYTHGEKPAYVPLKHKDAYSLAYLDGQVDFTHAYKRLLEADIDWITHNGKFDMRFLHNTFGGYIEPYWDTLVAAKLLNENEHVFSLKKLHEKYVGGDEGFGFADLFKGFTFDMVPLDIAYLYAANDALITWELAVFQSEFLHDEAEDGLDKVHALFENIEMPLIRVLAEMEDTGIKVHTETQNRLAVEFQARLDKAQQQFDTFLRDNNLGMVNINSPTQLTTFLYDDLGIKTNDRSTGEKVLKRLNHPVVDIILEYRGIKKLISTYIDKLPKHMNPITKRVHANFNQLGADTGRMSSSNPNMQNIPARHKEIRHMFCASEGNVLISSDFSAQEPRLLAHLTRDRLMVEAYKKGQDLYAFIASLIYKMPYEKCLEFNKGVHQPDGKQRRDVAKIVVLGVCYGMGIGTLARNLNMDYRQAKEVYDALFNAFPSLSGFIEQAETSCKETGYVVTNWGRKRRLPDLSLPEYETSIKNKHFFLKDMRSARSFDERGEILEKYRRFGKIIDNTGKIATAKRQSVNSIIQGSAADQTKLAMVRVGTDERLKEIGFKLLIQVHDELIGECPKEHADEAAERLVNHMLSTYEGLLVTGKCDVTISTQWGL